MSLKLLRKNFKILFCIFLILLTFNILVLNYVVKQYSIDVQAFKNKQLKTIYSLNSVKGGSRYKSSKWGGVNLFPDDDDEIIADHGDDLEEDELLQLNTNFVRFSNMRHGKLLINDRLSSKNKNSNNNNNNNNSNKKNNNNISSNNNNNNSNKKNNIDNIDNNSNKELTTESTSFDEFEFEDEEYEELENNLIISNLDQNSQSKKLRLVISVPTLPREKDHLSAIVSSFEEQSKENSALSGLEIKVIVFNNSPGNHPVFYKLKEHYKYKYTNVFSFIDNPSRVLEDESKQNIYYNSKITNKMKQKNLDVSNMLRIINNQTGADFILVMEDDFPLCSKTISILPYLIKKSNLYNRKWDLIKTSVGLNGFIFKSAQIDRITNYLEKNRHYNSIERLLSEWMCGMREIGLKRTGKCNESRRNSIIFRLTLFSHINGDSTFKRDSFSNTNHNGTVQFPQCWYDYSHLLNSNDKFYIKQCSDDDIAPCIQYHPIASMVTDLTEASSHLNHYLKSRIIVSPTSKRNTTLEVSFVQRPLPILFRSTSVLEDTFNFSTSTSASKLLKQSLKNQNGKNSKNSDQFYYSNIEFNDQEEPDEEFEFEFGNPNLVHGLLIVVLLSITGSVLIILFKNLSIDQNNNNNNNNNNHHIHQYNINSNNNHSQLQTQLHSLNHQNSNSNSINININNQNHHFNHNKKSKIDS